jgi:peptidyl-prolyl cis-trans isomerase SurA
MKLFTCLLATTILSSQLMAQQKKVVADRIVAQVGNKIILKSDIDNAISDYKAKGQEASLPANPECAFLEGQLIQKALLTQAEKDSLVVSDDEVDATLDNQIRSFIREYGSQQAVEEIYGKTIYQLKDDFKHVFKDRKLSDLMRNKIIENIKITPNEVKAFYDKIPKDSLPYYESELELQQIIAVPKAIKDVEEYVMKQLYEYKRQVETGAKRFDELAKLYTDDPGSKETGGQYNINRTEKFWDPTFLSTSFKLKEGQISPVIKSKFGYHIIQLVSRSGDDAIVRHILKVPPVTELEVKATMSKLDTVKMLIQNKDITFGEALNKFSDDENNKNSGGQITGRDGLGNITYDMMDKEMLSVVKTLNPGEFAKPQIFVDERGQKKIRLIYFKSRSNPHRMNLKDDYNKLSQLAVEEKKQMKLEKWFRENLPNYFITIDKEYNNCKAVSSWLKFIVN